MTPLDPLFSIIIPVYNVEKYLKECLDSIYDQTYNNLEIIIVNDGSTDSSPSIIKEYMDQKQKNRKEGREFVFINQENKGLSGARNSGLKVASGQWVWFVDSDDFVELDACSSYAKWFGEYGVDVVYNSFWICDSNGKPIDNKLQWGLLEIDKLESGARYLFGEKRPIFAFAWKGAIKLEFLKKHNLSFYEGIYYEDILFGVELFMADPNAYIAKKPLYNYRESSESIMRGKMSYEKFIKSIQSYLICANELKKISDGLNNEILIKKFDRFISYCVREAFGVIERNTRLLKHGTQESEIYANMVSFRRYMLFRYKVLLSITSSPRCFLLAEKFIFSFIFSLGNIHWYIISKIPPSIKRPIKRLLGRL